MFIFIGKKQLKWSIGGLEHNRAIYKTFIYILYFILFMFLNSNPPRRVKEVIKIKSYIFGGLFLLCPCLSSSSRLTKKEIEEY